VIPQSLKQNYGMISYYLVTFWKRQDIQNHKSTLLLERYEE